MTSKEHSNNRSNEAALQPNTRYIWNTLVNAAANFLKQIWMVGGPMGNQPDEAFRVQCGIPETMMQSDIDTGLLKVHIAITPIRPAGFIVFTVSQLIEKPGDSPVA